MRDFYSGLTLKIQNDQVQADFGGIFAPSIMFQQDNITKTIPNLHGGSVKSLVKAGKNLFGLDVRQNFEVNVATESTQRLNKGVAKNQEITYF